MAYNKNKKIALLFFATIISSTSNSAEPARTTDRLIVKYKSSAELPSGATRAQALGATTGQSLRHVRTLESRVDVVALPSSVSNSEARRLANQIQANPDVEYAEPDYKMFPALTPTDRGYSPGIDFDNSNTGISLVLQWYLSDPSAGINAPLAWDITTGSASTVVAVIDTGVLQHADLTGRLVDGYDFIGADPNGAFDTANDGDGRDADARDPGTWITAQEAGTGNYSNCGPTVSDWHGTHIAGIIAANANNIQIAGINWAAKILPVRVLGKCGGYTSDIIDGMRWAVGMTIENVPANLNPARILNLSLGIPSDTNPPSCTRAMQSAINDVLARGATVVVAAGNGDVTGRPQDSSHALPANCAGVISAAATLKDGQFATSYSNFGPLISLSAPGGLVTRVSSDFGQNGILSLNDRGNEGPRNDSDGATGSLHGTSFSSAIVSGVASLVLAANPNLTSPQIKAILQSTARRPSNQTETGLNCGLIANHPCQQYVVDAAAAVAKAKAINDGVQGILQVLDANGQPISSLDFGNLPLGQSAGPKTIIVRNTSAVTVSIANIVVSGQHIGDFLQFTTCANASTPFDLAPGASCSIDVTFTAKGNDVRTANVVVVSNVNLPVAVSGSGPQSVTNSNSGGGGGCAFHRGYKFDLSLLGMLLVSAISLTYRRRARP
jgi:serine protease